MSHDVATLGLVLTYMSRDKILQKAIADRRVFKLKPLPFPGDPIVELDDEDFPRTVYVTPDVDIAVMEPFPDTEEGYRLGEFRAWLDDFLWGAEISVCEDPFYKPPQTDLARVAPVEAEFWSIRVRLPKDSDGLRSIGAFHALNEFIALRWQYREVIGDDFDQEVVDAQADWQDIFEDEPPHKGGSLDEYLTDYMALKA